MKAFLVAIDSGLNEAFEKLERALDGLSEDELHWRPTLESNSIDWMVWHMARVEDNLVSVVLQEKESIWLRGGWMEKTGIAVESTGAGMSAEEVRALGRLDVSAVMDYYGTVREATSEYFEEVMVEEDLSRVIEGTRFAGVTGGWVLGRLLCEEAEHLGQIEYLRGMMRGLDK